VVTLVNDSLKMQNLQVTSLDDGPLDDVERPLQYGQIMSRWLALKPLW
jgi:phage gp45-like